MTYIERKVAEFKEIQKESYVTATPKPLLLQPEAVAWYEQDLIETINHAEQEMMRKVGAELDSLPTFVYTGDMHSNSVHMVVKMEDVKAILNLQDNDFNLDGPVQKNGLVGFLEDTYPN